MRYSSLSLLGLLCLATIVSCSQDAAEPVIHDGPSVVLRASFAENPATRTSFGEFTTTGSFAEILWNVDDSVKVFFGDKSARYETNDAGKTAVFSLAEGETVEGMASASKLYGLYPYQADASASFASSTITASIPSSQVALPNTFDPQSYIAVGVANTVNPEAPTTDMEFHNLCGGFCFTLQNPSRYSSIELSGNSGEAEAVCGDIEISMSDPANPKVSVRNPQTKIILTPAEGTTFQAGVRYYISLLPGNFASGFTLNFIGASDEVVETCVCEANVSFRRSAFAYVSNADDPAKLAAIRDGELLSTETEAANCYIVSKPGTYCFPLVRGIDLDAALQNVANVEVLWETANTASAPAAGSIVTDVAINKNCVYFKVPDPMENGNALIAAKSADDKILWSWHIWACSGYDPEVSSHLLQGKSQPMMDRNLGALAASASDPLSNGLFYQWGRKDPFPGAEERYVPDARGGRFFATTGGTLKTTAAGVAVDVAYTIAHPTEFITSTGNWLTQVDHTLWNKAKNDYDPCPIGWKVPSCYSYEPGFGEDGHKYDEEAWGNVSYVRYQDAARGYGAYFTLDNGGQSWYPNTGYISTGGQLLMVGQYSIYWSCDPMGSNVFGLELSQNMRGEFTLNPSRGGKNRGEGYAVRCIKDTKN